MNDEIVSRSCGLMGYVWVINSQLIGRFHLFFCSIQELVLAAHRSGVAELPHHFPDEGMVHPIRSISMSMCSYVITSSH